MKKQIFKSKLIFLLPLVAIAIGVLFVSIYGLRINNSASGTPIKQGIIGEFSYDGENWYSLEETEKLNGNGDVVIRGHFENVLPKESRLNFFSEHIGVALYVNGELYINDILFELDEYGIKLEPTICGSGWEHWYFDREITEEDEIELHIYDPHKHFNEGAPLRFLNTMCITPDTDEILSAAITPLSRPMQIIGIVAIIVAIFLLGASIASAFLRMKNSLFNIGMFTLFIGGFIALDTIGYPLFKDDYFLNTYTKCICFMMMAYWLGLCTKDALTGRRRKIGAAAMLTMGVCNSVMILLSFFGAMLIYDLMYYWQFAELICLLVMLVLAIAEMYEEKIKSLSMSALYILLHVSLLLDFVGVGRNSYSYAVCTKLAFLAAFIYLLVYACKRVVSNQQAAILAEDLQSELEDSRISLMLSQIQPHFLYNVLGTIRSLCREQPERAWEAIGDFSGYLRGNMNALSNKRLIHFESELRQIEAYLKLEKMRMSDRLEIEYDVGEKDFFLPPLTVQPLVENAVKHGVFHLPNGGKIKLSTYRKDDMVYITVTDNGVGFDTSAPPSNAEHTHIGLQNVRGRLEKMCKGSLVIESAIGKGTVASITLDGTLKP